MFKGLLPLLTASLALSALAAGCGQARDAEAPPTPSVGAAGTLTKSQFIAEADAICERMNTRSVAIAKRLRSRSPEEIGKRAIVIQAKAIEELEALPVPAGDERAVGAVLSHLRGLQAAMRALLDGKGEDALPAVAAIAVEMDAVARAAKRYGMFRRCGAYHENPEVRRILRGQDPPVLKGPDGKPLRSRPQRPFVPQIRRVASSLVPPGRGVLKREDCSARDALAPTCVIFELALDDRPAAARRAELARRAARAGWTQPTPTRGSYPATLLLLHRDHFDATVWLAEPDCTPQLQVGDGPNPSATTRRCVDTLMVTDF